MNDVTKALEPKSDQLNADSLITGPRTIKIRDVKVNSTPEQPIWIYYEGDDGKPWKPCKTAGRCLASVWGANAKQWIGMSCTIFNDTTVTWAGAAVGGIRVSHMEGLSTPRTLQLAKTRGKKEGVTIKPLVLDSAVDTTVDVADVLRDAMGAANKGKASFTKWWQENKDKQHMVKDKMDDFKKAAADFDDGGAM